MKQITSTHNAVYKNLRQLASSAKHRKRAGQTLLEGVHLCQSYLEHVGTPQMIIYTDPATENPEVADIIARCNQALVSGILLSEAHFGVISSVENGIGIAFLIDVPTHETHQVITSNALLLEDVQDPGNMGAILRTAAAAGVSEVYTSAGSSSAWSPKVLRAGMGAHFALTIYENCDLADAIGKAQVQVLATSLEATETIYEKDLSRSTAWLFGNEGSGVSGELLSLNIQRVIIPQNPAVESLNVAASTAVCLFEQRRQQTPLK
jgi:TrmH family RNA methyltransferase